MYYQMFRQMFRRVPCDSVSSAPMLCRAQQSWQQSCNSLYSYGLYTSGLDSCDWLERTRRKVQHFEVEAVGLLFSGDDNARYEQHRDLQRILYVDPPRDWEEGSKLKVSRRTRVRSNPSIEHSDLIIECSVGVRSSVRSRSRCGTRQHNPPAEPNDVAAAQGREAQHTIGPIPW